MNLNLLGHRRTESSVEWIGRAGPVPRGAPWHHIKASVVNLNSQEADGGKLEGSGSSHVSAGRSIRRSRPRSGWAIDTD